MKISLGFKPTLDKDLQPKVWEGGIDMKGRGANYVTGREENEVVVILRKKWFHKYN